MPDALRVGPALDDLHRVVDHRGRGNPGGVLQLVEPEPQRRAHIRIEVRRLPLRQRVDGEVERQLPALHAGRQFGQQCPIARVGQRRVRLCERSRQIPAARIDGREDFGGRTPGRRDHGATLARSGASARRPSRHSRAVITRLPSGCTRHDAQRRALRRTQGRWRRRRRRRRRPVRRRRPARVDCSPRAPQSGARRRT